MAELREANPVEVLRNRDPVAFLQRRADALAQRSADLKKLAAAWPLYKTLSPDQKQRMAFLALYVLLEMRNVAEERTEDEGTQYGDRDQTDPDQELDERC